MKQVKEVKVPAKVIKATTKTVETVYCDICLYDDIKRKAERTCTLCKRDICRGYNMEGRIYHSTWDQRDDSDYPSTYCVICAKLKFEGEFNAIYEELQENLYREEEILDQKIKKTSLAQTSILK